MTDGSSFFAAIECAGRFRIERDRLVALFLQTQIEDRAAVERACASGAANNSAGRGCAEESSGLVLDQPEDGVAARALLASEDMQNGLAAAALWNLEGRAAAYDPFEPETAIARAAARGGDAVEIVAAVGDHAGGRIAAIRGADHGFFR